MKTIFPKKEHHSPKWFVIDATNQNLGRLSTQISKLLRGKETSFFTPGIDQGNYVIVLNANKIVVTGKKQFNKLYYRNSQRPGSLKIETFDQLQKRIPTRIIEQSVWGMLSKNHLGREHYKRLYIYKQGEIPYSLKSEQSSTDFEKNWIPVKF
jgi:large subunit ribosomal protein L13